MDTKRLFILFVVVALFPIAALPHDPGLSELRVHIQHDRVRLSLDMTQAHFERVRASHTGLITVNGNPVGITGVEHDGSDGVRVRLKARVDEIAEIGAPLLEHLPRGHRLYVRMDRDGEEGSKEWILSSRRSEVALLATPNR